MTVIAVLKESDESILLAADSRGVENPGAIRIVNEKKLQKHPHAPLIWGGAGSHAIIVPFNKWLMQYEWPPESWDSFRDEVGEYLARLNGRQRELIRLSGIEPKETDVASVLMTGWLDEPAILEFTDNGLITHYDDSRFHAIGSGKPHAVIAFRSLEGAKVNVQSNTQGITDSTILLQFVTTMAAQMSSECDLPIHIWRVTQDGVTDAQQDASAITVDS